MQGISVSARRRQLAVALYVCATVAVPSVAKADSLKDYAHDVRDYVLSPLSWNNHDWTWFAGSVAAIALAHQYDDNVQTHFGPRPLDGKDRHSTRDMLPIAALTAFVVADGYLLGGGTKTKEVAKDMLESGALAVGSTFVLKYAFGRERPNETLDDNRWRKHGSGFPSMHSSVAFAVATSFAERESEHPWTRRLVAYGLATGTAYARVHDNVHWLSDVVAGAALGVVTGRWVNHRKAEGAETAQAWSVSPMADGVGISWTMNLR
jgi:membrane-associated phospholipid phosphatase